MHPQACYFILTAACNIARRLSGTVCMWRSTLIISVAMPFSVIATFLVMQWMHITLNLVSLMGLSKRLNPDQCGGLCAAGLNGGSCRTGPGQFRLDRGSLHPLFPGRVFYADTDAGSAGSMNTDVRIARMEMALSPQKERSRGNAELAQDMTRMLSVYEKSQALFTEFFPEFRFSRNFLYCAIFASCFPWSRP
jgi:hypothetical protein